MFTKQLSDYGRRPLRAEIRNPKYSRYLISFIKIMAAFMTLLFPAVNGLFGKKGIKVLQFIIYQMGIDRAPILPVH